MAEDYTVTSDLPVSRVRWLVSKLPVAAVGDRDLLEKVGGAVLGVIKKAYLLKADRGTDEAGDSWPPSKRVLKHGGLTMIITRRLLNSIKFRVVGDVVEVYVSDMDCPYAKYHHRGAGTVVGGLKFGNLPQRRLWPETWRWPTKWWDRILGVARKKIIYALMRGLGRS